MKPLRRVSFRSRKKQNIILLILGSYQDASITRLRKLKQFMIGLGWERCYLVEDFDSPTIRGGEDEDAYLTRKSLYWIERCDACIFVFNAGANNESVGYELKHASDHLPAKLETTLVLIDSTGPYASTLVRGHIQSLKMAKRTYISSFSDEESLFKASRNAAMWFLRVLEPLIDIRSELD